MGKLITRGVLIAIVTVAVFNLVLLEGGDLARAQTMAFATLIMAQLAYVFDCRSGERAFWRETRPPNWFLAGAVLSSCLLMLAVIYHPFLGGVFYTVPLPLHDWAVAGGAGITPTILGSGFLLLKQALARIQKKTTNFH